MQVKTAYLILENGNIFKGLSSISPKLHAMGELVFNTGMTGYCESLTDPSYTGQLLTFTYPLIGNYGVPKSEEWESQRIQVKGLIIGEGCINWSHNTGQRSLAEWLSTENIPWISSVDTRALTKIIRKQGVMQGCICLDPEQVPNFTSHPDVTLVQQASIPKRQNYPEGTKKIIVVDCGMKENILRCLRQSSLDIHRVPYNEDYSEEDFDGIFISNGPGDPQDCVQTVEILKKAMKKQKPIFGICLGTQILALAAGAKTYKLPFGHRGHNQPCMNLQTEQCFMTSQNHGYAIDEASIPEDWQVSYRNLNDQSVEGIFHKTLPYFAVQFHPEAAPGPTDTQWLFNQFVTQL